MNDNKKINDELVVNVCHGKNCGRHAKYIMDRLEQVKAKGYKIVNQPCLCLGQCEKGPNIKINDTVYNNMNPIKVSELVKKLSER